MIVIPPPLTPALKPAEQLPSTPPSAITVAQEAPVKRGRGRPRGSGIKTKSAPNSPGSLPSSQSQEVKVQELPQIEAISTEKIETSTADTKTHRTPRGLYTNTKAAILARLCVDHLHSHVHVASDTPGSTATNGPRRRKEGKHDKEERVLDHREIHRFLHAEEEAKIRGRKFPVSAKRQSEVAEETVEKKMRSPTTPSKKTRQLGADPFDSEYRDEGEARRSGRKRQLSSKAVEV
ncbi:histone-lysine N-methyltransferase SUV420H [Apiospora phragmitis]|uniref:Histone-lysine N-methyltransferase SUV420H n=1 Tax=Apiospora phragmitis TaxID=2905665 RepID=A0ABR1UIN0_9PEZI